MSDDVWSAQNTTPDEIEEALREMLRSRHASNGALAPARVLNLVVVVDRAWKGEIANRLERVGHNHPSRTILCAIEQGRTALDAVAVMSYDEPTNGAGVMHESIEIDMGPDQIGRLDTIVDPVLCSGLPTMVWSPHGHAEAITALSSIIDVILLDSDDDSDCAWALQWAARELLESAYIVDLAWLRSTPWRERLAASFDTPDGVKALWDLDAITVRHQVDSRMSAMLLVGWLASRLHWDVSSLRPSNGASLLGSLAAAGHEVDVVLEPFDQDVPGLAGVTVAWGGGNSLSLDRGRGGLRARERSAGGERSYQILGASRGEGGILGEGVRQALLRDPTYRPALEHARSLCP